MNLCPRCLAFDIQSFRNAAYHIRGFRLREVISAVQDYDCAFCGFLCDILGKVREYWAHEERIKHEPWIHLRMSRDNNREAYASLDANEGLGFNRLDIYIGLRHHLNSYRSAESLELGGGAVSCLVFADLNSAAAQNGDVIGTYLGENPGSSGHFNAITTRTRKCIEQHPKCCKTASGGQISPRNAELPRRCIEIGETSARLKDTDGKRGTYITLSHRCVGETIRADTTKGNLNERMKSIVEHDLPKTFQDAINVVRRIGLSPMPYLWIDSLCVIHEGPGGSEGEDWNTETLKMSQYYQHSLFTIAATDASPDGFLAQRAPLAGQTVSLPYRDKMGREKGNFRLYARENGSDAYTDYCAYIQSSVLLSRGWVLQEWLLSRRMIHYSQGRIFFECQTDGMRNAFNESVASKDILSQTLLNTIFHDRRSNLKTLFETGVTGSQELWFRIVETYSALLLTRPQEERIMALAGVAQEVRLMIEIEDKKKVKGSGSRRDSYVAGLWLSDIHNGLLWEFKAPGEVLDSKFDAPSWSWARWSNAVRWRGDKSQMRTVCQISLIDGSWSRGNNPNEAATSEPWDVSNGFGLLQVKGRVETVLLGPTLDRSEHEKIALFTGIDTELRSRWRAISSPKEPHIHIGWADVHLPSSAEHTLLALHVSTQSAVPGGLQFGYWSLWHPVFCVLFIAPESSTAEDGSERFMRIGVGRIFSKDYFRDAEEMSFVLE